ncbi:leucine-rich repeat domain-containing protein [Ralstonia pseudosolanacearum]|uniref:T3SS leucine-rich repeat effector RipAC/PopC n=2 Tax=Ralstonia solanacearum TaxID=305 RepID=A0ABY6NJB5_RALSL|nr:MULTISPECIES: T3SS leucine-rich repeat effector RipAC/PopC [Ralstonia]UZF17418.1 T3SS leucine-rich repeat effector RipAC/PopC [Ralstonia solanacearum]UZF32171.1 T3SS leucine-rich repeat effector RipAC/PopC [Ralstonia sp. RS650]
MPRDTPQAVPGHSPFWPLFFFTHNNKREARHDLARLSLTLMPILPRLFHRTSRTSSADTQRDARTPPNASPLHGEPGRTPRSRGELGRNLRLRSNAQTSGTPGTPARPQIRASASRTAPSTPQHPQGTEGTRTVPNSPLHNDARVFRERADHTGLSAWRTEMLTRFIEHSRKHGLANDFEQVRVYDRLSRAVDHLKSVLRMSGDSVQLKSLPVPELPDVTFEIAHLKNLETVDCDLHALPATLENLFLLETLSLKGAKNLKALPDAVWRLPALQELKLSETGLKSLPPVGGGSALQRLTIEDSPLEQLPAGFADLDQLASLSLSNTKLEKLSSGIGQLPALKSLSLQDNPKLERLPKSLGQVEELTLIGGRIHALPSASGMSSLQKLTVDNSSLAKLPADFGALGNLAHVSLSNTKLRDLPASIGNLFTLKTLSLQDNPKLGSLPASFGQLSGLQELTLNGNRIHELPSMGGVSSLQTLTVDDTALAGLPADFGALRNLAHLSLSNTQLRELPANTGNLHALKTLSLQGNQQLATLPSSLGYLSGLEELTLKNSSVSELPPMGPGSALKTLTVENSPLTSIPADIGIQCERLTQLSLSNTQLRALPSSIGKLSNLKGLTLKNNARLELLSESGVRKLESVRKIDLSGCVRLTGLPSSIGKLPKLRTLDLSGCTGLSMASLPRSLVLPRDGLNVIFPEHLKTDVGNARIQQNPRARLLEGHLERQNEAMNHAMFGDDESVGSMTSVPDNEAGVVSMAFHAKHAYKRLERLRQEAGSSMAAPMRNNDAESMRRALAYAFRSMSDLPTFKKLDNAARSLSYEVQEQLADLVAAPVGQKLVKAIAEGAYGAGRDARAIEQMLPELATRIANHPEIQQLREQAKRYPSSLPPEKLAAKLTPLIQPLWDGTRAVAPMPGQLRQALQDLLVTAEGRQLASEIDRAAHSHRAGDEGKALRGLLPVLAAKIGSDPRVVRVREFVSRHTFGSPQQRAESLAQTLTPVVQELWAQTQAEVAKQGQTPAASPSRQR